MVVEVNGDEGQQIVNILDLIVGRHHPLLVDLHVSEIKFKNIPSLFEVDLLAVI